MKLTLICLVGGLTHLASAFDGNKEGFVLGGAIGMHSTSITEAQEYGQFGSYHASGTIRGIASDLLTGYGFNPNFFLIYQFSSSWYQGNGKTYYDAVGPVGARYYFRGDEPGAYFGASGLFGSYFNMNDRKGIRSQGGFTLSFGYEFSRHYSIETKFCHVSAQDGSITHTSNSFQALIEAMAF